MANSPAPAWKIEYQVPSVDTGPDGRAAQGMRIGFSTSKGVHSYVFLTNAAYSLAAAQKAISEKAALIDAVHELKG